jgi:hypothetical protein
MDDDAQIIAPQDPWKHYERQFTDVARELRSLWASLGFHGYDEASDLIDDALKLVAQALLKIMGEP